MTWKVKRLNTLNLDCLSIGAPPVALRCITTVIETKTLEIIKIDIIRENHHKKKLNRFKDGFDCSNLIR